MKKCVAIALAGIATMALTTGVAEAASPARMALDNYGCRWETTSQTYRCYQGAFAGRQFVSQQQMLQQVRVTPVYVDDSGAARSMPPHAARGGRVLPSTGLDVDDVSTWNWRIFE
jgi:hypothetical protein